MEKTHHKATGSKLAQSLRRIARREEPRDLTGMKKPRLSQRSEEHAGSLRQCGESAAELRRRPVASRPTDPFRHRLPRPPLPLPLPVDGIGPVLCGNRRSHKRPFRFRFHNFKFHNVPPSPSGFACSLKSCILDPESAPGQRTGVPARFRPRTGLYRTLGASCLVFRPGRARATWLMRRTTSLIAWLTHFGYWALFLGMAAESAAIPLPSEVILPFGGYLVSTGRLELVLAAVAAVAGGLFGSVVLYVVGLYGGRPLLERYGRLILIQKHHLDDADRFFRRYGGWSVFIGRLLPGIRTYISLPAGIGEMPFGPFLIYSFLGSIPWTVALLVIGDMLGKNWHNIGHSMTKLYVVLGVLILIGLAVWYVRARRASTGRRSG